MIVDHPLTRCCSHYDEHWRKCMSIFEGLEVVVVAFMQCEVFVADRQIKKIFHLSVYNRSRERVKEHMYGGFGRCRHHLGVPDPGREVSGKPFGFQCASTRG